MVHGLWRLVVIAAALLLAGCTRLGFSGSDSRAHSTDQATSSEDEPAADLSPQRDALFSDDAVDGGDVVVKPDLDLDGDPWLLDGTQQLSVALANTGEDTLNTAAAGSLTWSPCGATFSGEVVLSGLAPGHVYQLKLEIDWKADHEAGKALSSIGRTWDETIWELGDLDNRLPAPHTGTAPGDEAASNVGNYLSAAELEALSVAGHELLGYLMFAFFTLSEADNAQLTEDDSGSVTPLVAAADGLHVPFSADFSWHTSTSVEKGFITFPGGSYSARFLITRESGSWPSPLLTDGVAFEIGPCL